MPPLDATFGLVNPFAYGPAYTASVAVPEPAAGDVFAYPVGGNYVERVVAVGFTFHAVGMGASREIVLQWQDEQGHVYAASSVPSTPSTGETWQFSFALDGTTASLASGKIGMGVLPPLFMQPGDELALLVDGITGTDQVAAVVVRSERFSTAPDLYAPGFVPDYATS